MPEPEPIIDENGVPWCSGYDNDIKPGCWDDCPCDLNNHYCIPAIQELALYKKIVEGIPIADPPTIDDLKRIGRMVDTNREQARELERLREWVMAQEWFENLPKADLPEGDWDWPTGKAQQQEQSDDG